LILATKMNPNKAQDAATAYRIWHGYEVTFQRGLTQHSEWVTPLNIQNILNRNVLPS